MSGSGLVVALLTALLLLTSVAACSGAGNLVVNPGFDTGADPQALPKGWWLWEQEPGMVGCAVDTSVRHSGEKTFRMSAAGDASAVLVADDIPVMEGEKFQVNVWVRAENLKPTNPEGCVTFNAGFRNSDGKFLKFKRFGTISVGSEWQRISSEVIVPSDVSSLALELGMKRASGVVWFHNPSVVALSPYTIRPEGSLEIAPGTKEWPLEIVNRSGEKRATRLTTSCAGKTGSRDVRLDGSDRQTAMVPVDTDSAGSYTFHAKLDDPETGAVLAESTFPIRVLNGVELEPLVPTHFCIEDGKPSLEARVWNHLSADRVKGLSITLKTADGETLDSRTFTSVKTGWQDVPLSSEKAGLGDYRVDVKLTASDGRTYTASQPWHVIHRSQAKVVFNRDGYPEIDGKVIFPLGTFNSGRYGMMKDLGFTVTHAWNRMKLAPKGRRTDNQLAKDYLDETGKAGMKAIGFLHVTYMERQDWDGLRRRIRMFRNHPALLAWDQEEGVARGEVKMEQLRKLVQIVREEDPNHPFILADSYDEVTKVDRSRFFPENLMHGGMWWYYPIPLRKSSSALEGEDPSDGRTLNPPTFLRSTNKPVWVGLQAYIKPGKDGRLPTEAEARCMAYLSVIHGAKGLLYYMGGSAQSLPGVKDETKPWGYLHKLVPELSSMISVFMSHTALEKVTVAPTTVPIDTLLKRNGRTYTLIVVNRGDKPVKASITIPNPASGSVDVMFEGRRLDVKENTISDGFEGYGVHVYRWGRE